MRPYGSLLWEIATVHRDVEDPEAQEMAEAGAWSRLMDQIREAGYVPTDGRYSLASRGWHRFYDKTEGWVRQRVIGWSPDDAHRG